MRISDLNPGRLDEVHWTDLYPKSFSEFRARYLKLVRARKAYGLYVQFSNHADNTLDRVSHHDPDHHDPVGVYGYPLDYVLSHPADVWYGKGARYLRVLRDTSRNKLDLSSISDIARAENTLRRMGFDTGQIRSSLEIAGKVYRERNSGTNRFAKLFLSAAQVDLIAEPIGHEERGPFSAGGPQYRIRSGAEQTALFRKAGYDAIEDSARTGKSAIINPREPEQVIFLTRAAFRVVEVVALRPGVPADELPTMTASDPNTTRIARPLASALAKALGDQVTEASNDLAVRGRHEFTGNHDFYWTVGGRRIKLRFDRDPSYYDRQIGEKRHKEDKLSDAYRISVEIRTELGDIVASTARDTTFEALASEVARSWRALQKAPQQTDWQPQSAASFAAATKAETNRQTAARVAAERAEMLAQVPEMFADIAFCAEHLGLAFTPGADDATNVEVCRMLKFLSLYARSSSFMTTGQEKEGIDAVVERWLDKVRTRYAGSRFEGIHAMADQIGSIVVTACGAYDPIYWIMQGEAMFGALRQRIEKAAA